MQGVCLFSLLCKGVWLANECVVNTATFYRNLPLQADFLFGYGYAGYTCLYGAQYDRKICRCVSGCLRSRWDPIVRALALHKG